MRAKLIIAVWWVIISALGTFAIVSFWNSHGDAQLGWYRATVFVLAMACVAIVGYRLYRTQGQKTASSTVVAGKCKAAFQTAIVLQFIFLLLSALMLDGGRAFHVCLVAAIGYWPMAGLIFFRRRVSPTAIDLVAVRYGYLPIILLVGRIGPAIWTHFGRW